MRNNISRYHLLLVIGLSIGLWTCNQTTPKEAAQQAASSPQALEHKLQKLNIQVEDAMQIDSSAYVMLPLKMGEANEQEGLIDVRSYKQMGQDTYWNIAFYHSGTETYHLLNESRRMLIYEIDTQAAEQKLSLEAKYIFYRIITADSNKDNRFNNEDLTYLFVSDREGRHFYQLSPSGYDLISYKKIKATSKLVMLVRKDSNGNLKYDSQDEQMAFIVDLSQGGSAKEIFTLQGKQNLKELFDRDWKRVE